MNTRRRFTLLGADFLRLLTVVLLGLPLAANAALTTWEIRGHITASQGAELAAFQPGDPFRILVNFDRAAVPSATIPLPPGTRYNYPASSLSFDIFIGSLGPFHADLGTGPNESGSIILRDNASFPNLGDPPVDGYSFGVTSFDPNDGGVFSSVLLVMRGSILDIVNGPGLAETPDPRLASLADHAFQVCRSTAANQGSCDAGLLDGAIDSVSAPSYGTGYLFTARDCRVVSTDAADSTPYDCVNTNRTREQQWTYPPQQVLGGGLGFGGFSQSHAPMDTDIDPTWNTGPLHASLGLPSASLGSLFGSISFSGPVALPIVKGSTTPSDVSRLNANLFGYQKYQYTGAATQLPLIVDLTYDLGDYNVDPSASTQIGLRPGGASLSIVMSVIDGGAVSMNQVRDVGVAGFGNLECGAEPVVGWPAGSILGTATFSNPEHQIGPQAVTRPVTSCANPGQPIELVADQSFVVATAMQTPSRGKAPQPPSTVGALTNGYVDAAHTLRVTFDPAAPPALIQQLADSIAPACVDCDFKPDVLSVAIDVKPGVSASEGCVSVGGKGTIPVALLGSATFNVKDVRLDDSLQFGALATRMHKGKPQCAVSRVNADAYDDLVCHFDNSPAGWQPGQTSAVLSGKLVNGVPIQGSESICLIK